MGRLDNTTYLKDSNPFWEYLRTSKALCDYRRKSQKPQAAPEYFSASCFECVPFQRGSHQLSGVSTASVVTPSMVMDNEQSRILPLQDTALPESGE